MSAELASAWEAATHIMQLVAAHGIVEAGKGPVVRGARAVVDWLHRHLPQEGQQELAMVLTQPRPSAAQHALQGRIGTLLEAQPEVFAELRALLERETGSPIVASQTLAAGARGAQVIGNSNTTTIAG